MVGRTYDPSSLKPLIDRIANGECLNKISKETGVSSNTLLKHVRKAGIDRSLKLPSACHSASPPPCPPPITPTPTLPPPQQAPPVGKRIAVIPDMQVKPGIDLSYAARIGRYLAHKKPDIIINGGDFADMPSLSAYDEPGSKGMEGQRYKEDILAVQTAMRLMMTPIREETQRTGWSPRLVMTLGNHEDRIRRAIEKTPKLEGTIGLPDLHYEEWGWEVYPFLEPVVIEGIVFAHYFCSGVMGRPITTARALLNKKHMSCFAFHQQGRDIAFGTRADGHQMIAIIAGSCYEHDEHYLNPQTNNHWRGLYILNDVIDGAFEENAVSLRYLKRRYG